MMAALVACIVGTGQAHADLTIRQVKNTPPGADNGNEWLTLINLGESDTFDGHDIRTTHGRIASHAVPTFSLDSYEYHRITFAKQTIYNQQDTVILLKDGTPVYRTPVIKDIKNDDGYWTNPDVAAVCDNPRTRTTVDTVNGDYVAGG